MAGRGITRFRLSTKRGDIVVRAEGQSPRGSTYALGEVLVNPRGLSKQERKSAVVAALDQLIAAHGNAR